MSDIFVFAYGSLAELPATPPGRVPAPGGYVAELPGYVRGWGVAMDNRVTLPGYKRYRRPDGTRPAVHVCFLDIAEAPGGAVNGVCLPVDAAGLAALDRRERNYVRRDVSHLVAGTPGATIFTYVGSPEGRRRRERGRRDGDAVIDARYLAGVRAAFARLGPDEAAMAAASLDPGTIPVCQLTREPLP